jgi:hypothetical protein
MTKPGQDVNGIARTEADHHMKCPACGQWFDMRDLGQALEHWHDGPDDEGARPLKKLRHVTAVWRWWLSRRWSGLRNRFAR